MGVETPIQTQQPIGQSFVPNLSSIGFIRFYLDDQTANGVGATVVLNLWSGSIGSGTLLASTDPIFIPHGFFDYSNFFFSTPVILTPSSTYYLQAFIQSGDNDNNMRTGELPGSAYPNGTAFISSVASPGIDLWFREGVVVPEPSTALLALFGIAGLCLHRNKFNRH